MRVLLAVCLAMLMVAGVFAAGEETPKEFAFAEFIKGGWTVERQTFSGEAGSSGLVGGTQGDLYFFPDDVDGFSVFGTFVYTKPQISDDDVEGVDEEDISYYDLDDEEDSTVDASLDHTMFHFQMDSTQVGQLTTGPVVGKPPVPPTFLDERGATLFGLPMPVLDQNGNPVPVRADDDLDDDMDSTGDSVLSATQLDAQDPVASLNFRPLGNGMIVAAGTWPAELAHTGGLFRGAGGAGGTYTFSVGAYDRWVLSVQHGDQQQVDVYTAKRIVHQPPKTFFQKYGTFLMMGGFFILQIWMRSKASQAQASNAGAQSGEAAAEGTAEGASEGASEGSTSSESAPAAASSGGGDKPKGD